MEDTAEDDPDALALGAARHAVAAQASALLVRVGRLCPPRIRGGCVDRSVVVNDQALVLARLLHPAAGEPGTGRILPLAHALHGATRSDQSDDIAWVSVDCGPPQSDAGRTETMQLTQGTPP